MTLPDLSWMDRGLCVAEVGPRAWEIADETTRRWYCRRCPVRAECREWMRRPLPNSNIPAAEVLERGYRKAEAGDWS